MKFKTDNATYDYILIFGIILFYILMYRLKNYEGDSFKTVKLLTYLSSIILYVWFYIEYVEELASLDNPYGITIIAKTIGLIFTLFIGSSYIYISYQRAKDKLVAKGVNVNV